MERLNAYRKFPTLKELFISKVPITDFGCLMKIWLNRKCLSLIENNRSHYVFNIKGTFFYIVFSYYSCGYSERWVDMDLYYVKDYRKLGDSLSIGGASTGNNYNALIVQRFAEKIQIYIEKHYLNKLN